MFRPGCSSTPPHPPPSPPTSWLPAAPSLPGESFLRDLIDEDLQCSDNQTLNRLLEKQEATFKLMADFVRESREFREFVTNVIRENGERKCCGCHCVKESQERVRVTPKQCSAGRLTTISTGDLRVIAVGDFGDGAVGDFGEGMVGDFGDGAVGDFGEGMVQDDAIATGISNSERDSGNVEQFGEEGDGFLQEAVKIKSGSSSVGNFAKRIVETIFQPGELEGRNCSGTRGKMIIDQGKLGIVKKYVFKLYPCGQAQEDAQWRKCVVAIDEFLRRAKGKGNRQQ